MTADASNQKPSSEQPHATPPTNRRWILPFGAITVCFLIVGFFWIQRGLGSARISIRSRDYESARSAAERYLWLHPNDAQARMLAAQGYSLDDRLPADSASEQAIAHLQRISDTDSLAAEARMLEGRLRFLILLQPTHAEKLFHQAIELNPDQFDAHYLLWKLHDMTERYFNSELYFRNAYRLIPDEQKAFRLREWYLSQFNPFSACAELDTLMGFRQPTEPTSETVAFRRLTAFAEQEPASPVVAAAIARAHLRNRQRDVALKTLEQLPANESVQHPFYIATLTEVLLELGQLERAKEVFARYPQPASGYEYWRIAGMSSQVADAEFSAAADLYQRATEVWPGPSDWLTIHRQFRCLALLGDKQAAAAAKKRSQDVQELMELEVHQRLKEALVNLADPESVRKLVDFYGLLNRPWEQQEWQAVLDRLQHN